MSLDFDGVDDWVNGGVVTVGATVSVSAWFNADTMGELNLGHVVAHSTSVENERFRIRFGSANLVQWLSMFPGGVGSWRTTTGFATLQGWKWLMVTYTIAVGEHPTFYLFDGTTYAVLTVGNGGVFVINPPTGTPPPDGGTLHIGTAAGNTQAFDGKIAEVGLWTRILSAADASAVFHLGVLAAPGNLLRYYSFDNGQAFDYSGNNAHGGLNGPVFAANPPTRPAMRRG